MSQTEHQTSAATSATGTRKTPRVEAEKIILGIDPGTNVLGYGVLCVSGRQVKMQAMGVIDLRRVKDVYLKLGRIHERVMGIIDSFLPDEVAIEAPFFAAAISRDIPIHEYAPLKIKMAITGNGQASKEQVAGMMQRMLSIPEESMLPYLDATDALAAAYCHYLHQNRPQTTSGAPRSWAQLAQKQGRLPKAGATAPNEKLMKLLKTKK